MGEFGAQWIRDDALAAKMSARQLSLPYRCNNFAAVHEAQAF